MAWGTLNCVRSHRDSRLIVSFVSQSQCHRFFQALVHVSTAYCNCNRQEVSELVYPPPADPEKIMQCVEWLEDDLLDAITPKQVVPVLTILVEGQR